MRTRGVQGRELARWQILTVGREANEQNGFPLGVLLRHLGQGAPAPAPARQSVYAVLPHTAYGRRSPQAFGLSGQALTGLGATTVPPATHVPERDRRILAVIGTRRIEAADAFDELVTAARSHGVSVFTLAEALVALASGNELHEPTAARAARAEWDALFWPTRRRERGMKRFASPGQAQRFLSAFGGIAGHFQARRHLLIASEWRREMTDRFAVWNEVTGVSAAA